MYSVITRKAPSKVKALFQQPRLNVTVVNMPADLGNSIGISPGQRLAKMAERSWR